MVKKNEDWKTEYEKEKENKTFYRDTMWMLVVGCATFIALVIFTMAQVNQMGEMVCKEQNSNYEFDYYDSSKDTIVCQDKGPTKQYDGGYIRVERGD